MDSNLTLCTGDDTVTEMGFPARSLGLLVACAAAACSGNPGPPLRVRVAHAVTPDARCWVPGGGPQPDDQQLASVALDDLKVDSVRLSVRTHAAGDLTGNFLCDRVFKVPREVPDLKIPRNGAQSVDIYAEAYAPIAAGDSVPRRVAVGSLLGVPLTSKTIADLRLYPDERFRCLNDRLARPRAFHTATVLPNGEVLVVGGLTPTPDAGEETFGAAPVFVTSEAEIYDPSSGKFVAVAEDDGPVPRAFHQAAFIGTTDDGKYQVLLVGGATADATMAAFGINTGAAPGSRIVPFDTSGTFPNPLPVAAAPAELLVYNPADHSASRTLIGGFTPGVYQAAAPFADGIAVAGGIDWMNMPLQAMIPTVKRIEVSRAQETPPRFIALGSARMGATMTALTDDVALVWGGQITPTDPAGEYVSGLGAKNLLKVVPVTLATAPPTQFHSATLLPADMTTQNRTIVVTGGFLETTTNMGQALQPPAPMQAARLLTVSTTGTVAQTMPVLSTYVPDSTCSLDTRYRPAGWQSAVDIGRGRVLITGGAPTVSGSCNDCDDGGSDYRCATGQASLFAASTLSPTRDKTLQIPRYGHTSTLLHDGNVLIVGGVTSSAGAPRILRDVEVYNPRPIVPQFDASSGNPDPDDPVAGDLTSMVRTPGAPLDAKLECSEL
jgi:hypothetical protein